MLPVDWIAALYRLCSLSSDRKRGEIIAIPMFIVFINNAHNGT